MFVNQNVFIQLPFQEVQKNKETIKLTNLPRIHNVDDLFPEMKYLNNVEEAEFQHIKSIF